MKKSLKYFIVAAFMGMAVAASGQQMQPHTPEEKAQRQSKWMDKNLGLTREQSAKVYDIMLYYARENDSAAMLPKGREKHMEKKDIKKGRDGELRAVLSPDQYARYEAHVAQMKEKMRERRAGMQGEY